MTDTPYRPGSLDDDLDPDLRLPSADEETPAIEGLLSDLEQALTADVDFEPITLEIVKRPGVSVRYRTQLTNEQIEAWRKRAKDKRAVDGTNNLRFCALIVANQCEAILMRGQEVHDEAGQNLTFGHARIKRIYGMQPNERASECAVKVIGSDPHTMTHANMILDASGFGDQAVEVEGEDPSGAS